VVHIVRGDNRARGTNREASLRVPFLRSQPGPIAKADWQFSLKLRGPWAWSISKVGVFDIFVPSNWDAVAHHPNQQRVSFAAGAHLTANAVRRHRWHVSLTPMDCLTPIFRRGELCHVAECQSNKSWCEAGSEKLIETLSPRFAPSRRGLWLAGYRVALRRKPIRRWCSRASAREGTYRGDSLYQATLAPAEYRAVIGRFGFEVIGRAANDLRAVGHRVALRTRGVAASGCPHPLGAINGHCGNRWPLWGHIAGTTIHPIVEKVTSRSCPCCAKPKLECLRRAVGTIVQRWVSVEDHPPTKAPCRRWWANILRFTLRNENHQGRFVAVVQSADLGNRQARR